METLKYMYRGTCLLRHWFEHLSLDGSRGLERRLCQVSRVRQLAMMMAMVIEMVTAQLAAAALTRRKSKQCSWLGKVSICAAVEENESRTHRCHQGHLSDSQNIRLDPLGVDSDAED